MAATGIARCLMVALLSTAAAVPLAARAADERASGSELVMRQERLEYRQRVQAVKTRGQREQVRAEQHERILERARKKGAGLPDAPATRGMERGAGPGGMGGRRGH